MTDARINDMALLHPTFADRLVRLLHALPQSPAKPTFRVFETVRAPMRQDQVFAAGRSRARAYQSAHQFGLGADLVPVADGKDGHWYWPAYESPEWEPLLVMAPKFGLETLSFERPHVQIAGFDWKHMAIGPADTAGWLSWLDNYRKGAWK